MGTPGGAGYCGCHGRSHALRERAHGALPIFDFRVKTILENDDVGRYVTVCLVERNSRRSEWPFELAGLTALGTVHDEHTEIDKSAVHSGTCRGSPSAKRKRYRTDIGQLHMTLLGAGNFTFYVSFSLASSRPGKEKTLPVKLWDSILFEITPILPAITAIVVAIPILMVAVLALLQRQMHADAALRRAQSKT
jgi:hypothetical protein